MPYCPLFAENDRQTFQDRNNPTASPVSLSDRMRLEGSNETKHTTLPTLQQMSDTPETDKAERMAFSQEHMVPTEFARQLERERNQLREIVEQRLLAGAEIHQKANDLLRKVEILESDRERTVHMTDYHFSRLNKAIDALKTIEVCDWKTSGELRNIARTTIENLEK